VTAETGVVVLRGVSEQEAEIACAPYSGAAFDASLAGQRSADPS
jgi:hypothetical protein